MLVYLKGISKSELENITNFLYDGETFVSQNQLSAFLETAQELKVKGLQTIEENESCEPAPEVQISVQDSKRKHDVPRCKLETQSIEENNVENVDDKSLALINDSYDYNLSNRELDKQLEEIVEKCMGLWKCKICNKTGKQKVNLKTHAEIHVQGMIYSCNECGKTFSTKSGLRTHVNDIHSKLYSCNICGKQDMNKMAVRLHKTKCSGTPEEQ